MLEKLKETFSRSDDFDYAAAVEENSTDEDSEGYDVEAQWGHRADDVPKELPAGVNSMLTSVSASSAHLLSEGGRFGSAYCKVMYVPKDGWPPEPKPGLLDRLASHGSSGIQFKLRIDPMSSERSVAEFKRRIRDKNKTLYAKQQSSAPDTAVVADEKQELEDVLRSLKSGSERIYWVGVYFVIRGQTKKKVDKAQDEIARELAKDDVTATTADWVPKEGMTTVSPIGKFELSETTRTPMTGSALGCLYAFSTTNMIEEDGILFGYHGLNGSPITIDRWNRRNGYNQLVIGNIGAGKSYGVKLLLLRRLVRDRDVSAVIVDPRGGFRSLVDAFGIEAETVTVGGNVGINPLQISPTPDDVLDARPDMDPLGERMESAMGFFETAYAEGDSSGLSAQERAVLAEAMTDAYNQAGITREPQTHRRKSPLISDVDRALGRYARDPTTALGDDRSDRELDNWAEMAADLRVALQPFREGGRYQHLNQPTDIGLGRNSDKRVILLDIQQSEASGNMPLTMKLLFDAIYERAKGPDRMIAAFDEAHHIMQNPGGLDWLERSVRYSRHFDLSLTLISQTADEFFAHEKAKTIADNCPIKWLFRTTGLDDNHGEALGLTSRQNRFVRQATPGDRDRGWSHSLLSVDDLGTVPIRVEALEGEESVIDPAPAQANGGDEVAEATSEIETGRFEFE
jgi:hypothetical protein